LELEFFGVWKLWKFNLRICKYIKVICNVLHQSLISKFEENCRVSTVGFAMQEIEVEVVLPLYCHKLTQSYNQVVAVAHSNLPKALLAWISGFAEIALPSVCDELMVLHRSLEF
jgi:hypothetical protein